MTKAVWVGYITYMDHKEFETVFVGCFKKEINAIKAMYIALIDEMCIYPDISDYLACKEDKEDEAIQKYIEEYKKYCYNMATTDDTNEADHLLELAIYAHSYTGFSWAHVIEKVPIKN